MKSRGKHPRISIQQDADLSLYDRSNDSQLTGGVAALLLDLSRQGTGLNFSQVFIDGRNLFYVALDSDNIFITIVLRTTDDDPEKNDDSLGTSCLV